MKQLTLIILAGLLYTGHIKAQTTSGTISTDETWTAAMSPVTVTGDITVNSGVTLSIDPGVEVEFSGDYKILVHGSVSAVGTSSDSIIFGRNTTEWNGFEFGYWYSGSDYVTYGGNGSASFTYCCFENASHDEAQGGGSAITSCQSTNLTIDISHCSFKKLSSQSYGGAIHLWDNKDSMNISDCYFSGNIAIAGGALSLYSTTYRLVNNVFVSDSVYGGTSTIGGAVFIYQSNGRVQENEFTGNVSLQGTNSSSGGAIFVDGGTLSIIKNRFYNNEAYEVGGGNCFMGAHGQFKKQYFLQ